ncbi:hypothetical protein ABL78_8134 [Leptomonas seymouri]|uniref:WASH1 WAHD domain-containing protein n=1 Tax=Leptomonas seymouri TaxID=5684 RepID=A0A0N1PAV3_LEPSE|nr:hypothetical protein ABL78_8134 [Leptomonas seymouri]|eukprot:KPI82854.1 hypothetical protein ABL78_8134 [Leptomonas seymouri]
MASTAVEVVSSNSTSCEDSDVSSSGTRSSSLDSTRAAGLAYAYDTASVAQVPGLVVPLVPPSKGGCAALASAVFALEQLSEVMDAVFDRVDRTSAARLRRLEGLQARIAVCARATVRMTDRRASTLLESKPRYPLPTSTATTASGKAKKKRRLNADGVDTAASTTCTTAMAELSVASAVYTPRSDRYLRPRRSSPLPAVAPSSCSSSSGGEDDDDSYEAIHPLPRPSYQRTLRTITPVPAASSWTSAAVAAALRAGEGPLPPTNPMHLVDLAESMPLESVMWDVDDRSGNWAVMMGDSVATATADAAAGGAAPLWQPRRLPVVRGGQALHAVGEMPNTISALISFPARRVAYRRLVASPSGPIVVSPMKSGTAGRVATHADPSPERRANMADVCRSVRGGSTVNLQQDFISPSQAQQYAFVPGGGGPAASTQALLSDLPRNLPLRHIAAVRRWDQQRTTELQQRHRRGGGDEDTAGEHHDVDGVFVVEDSKALSRGGGGAHRGDGGLLGAMSPSRQQWQQRRLCARQQQRGRAERRYHADSSYSSGNSDAGDDGSRTDDESDEDGGSSARRRRATRGSEARRGVKSSGKLPLANNATKVSGPSLPPPGLPPPSTSAPPPPPPPPPFPGPPGVTRSTTAPPPPPLPPAALLLSKPNPPMPTRAREPSPGKPPGSEGPPRLPPPPPPPPSGGAGAPPLAPSSSASGPKSVVGSRPPQKAEVKVLHVSPPAGVPPPPPPPPPSQLYTQTTPQPPLGVLPGGSRQDSKSLPPPPAGGGLSTALSQRRKALQGDVTSDGSDDTFSDSSSDTTSIVTNGRTAGGKLGSSLKAAPSPSTGEPTRAAAAPVSGARPPLPGAHPRPPLLGGDSSSDDSNW